MSFPSACRRMKGSYGLPFARGVDLHFKSPRDTGGCSGRRGRMPTDPPSTPPALSRLSTAGSGWSDETVAPLLWLIVASAALLLWPDPLLANMGLPMVAMYLPPAWILLVPIIAIEAGYGVCHYGIPAGRALAVQAASNCLSTLVGLPLTWIVLARSSSSSAPPGWSKSSP